MHSLVVLFLLALLGPAWAKYLDTPAELEHLVHLLEGQAEPGQFPFFTALIEDGRHICGGTLIHERWVLTARHCIEDQLVVAFGVDAENLAGHTNVDQVFIPSETKLEGNDIALLKLETAVKKSQYIAPIQFPHESEKSYFENRQVTAMGFGRMSTGNSPRYLQYVNLTLSSCDPDERLVCAIDPQNPAKDTCNGDSGGPIVDTWRNGSKRILGITATGLAECNDNREARYTSVFYHSEWIKQTMRSQGDFI